MKQKTLKRQNIKSGTEEYVLDPSKRETTSGLFVSAGEISEDFDKVSWKELLEDYTSMRNGGAVESTTVSILKYPILRAGYTIEHEDEEMVDYCYWVIENLIDSFGDKDGFQEFLAHLFMALEYGCSFFEKIYDQGLYAPSGKITNTITRLAPFKPETIYEFHYDESMRFIGISHERREPNALTTFVNIPIEKIFFYAHNTEYGDPRGRSELRPVRNLYKIKRDILLATARAQQRGAGIPEIKIKKSGMTAEEKTRAENVGKSIGNMKSGYIITDENTEITLHSLQIQGSPEGMLEFINREMFFNTLTEFMTSGIGQSGSRSATMEHKGSYDLKCGAVTGAIEKRLNVLIREIIDISYYGPQTDYPTFKFNALQQTDIVSAASALTSFYTSAILVKQEGDEDFIRSLFNMPAKKLVNGVEVLAPVNVPDQVTNVTTVNKHGLDAIHRPKTLLLDGKTFTIKLSADEQSEFLKKNFDIDGATNLYISLQAEAEEIIADVVKKYILYIGKQVDAGAPVEIKYDVELSNRLNKLYREGREFGVEAVEAELAKLSDGVSLSSRKPKVGEVIRTASQSITRFVGRLLFNIKTVCEDRLDTDWKPAKSSASDYLLVSSLLDGFKTDRRTIIEKTTDGYMDGRGEALLDNRDSIELYFYNSVLDKNLCDTCATFTGAVMTLEEAISMELMPEESRVNPNCLGGLGRCRCNLMPYKLKGDFEI